MHVQFEIIMALEQPEPIHKQYGCMRTKQVVLEPFKLKTTAAVIWVSTAIHSTE